MDVRDALLEMQALICSGRMAEVCTGAFRFDLLT